MIKDCTVNINNAPSDDHVNVVMSLQEVMMKQLEVLEAAHQNLKPTMGPVTGIHMEGVTNGAIDSCSIERVDTGVFVEDSKRTTLRNSIMAGL
jgi:hypothetical protein